MIWHDLEIKFICVRARTFIFNVLVTMLGTRSFLMGMNKNCKGMDKNCREMYESSIEIDLI